MGTVVFFLFQNKNSGIFNIVILIFEGDVMWKILRKSTFDCPDVRTSSGCLMHLKRRLK